MGQGICENHTPEVMGFFAEATAGGEATQPADGVTERQARGKSITSRHRGNVVLVDIPCGDSKPGNQSTRKNSACLQSAQAENVADVSRVAAPLIDDIQNFGADDPGQYNVNS